MCTCVGTHTLIALVSAIRMCRKHAIVARRSLRRSLRSLSASSWLSRSAPPSSVWPCTTTSYFTPCAEHCNTHCVGRTSAAARPGDIHHASPRPVADQVHLLFARMIPAVGTTCQIVELGATYPAKSHL